MPMYDKVYMIELTIAEFQERYYLHDSTIENIRYDAENKKLTLTIDFCFWMQEWYEPGKDLYPIMKIKADSVTVTNPEQYT